MSIGIRSALAAGLNNGIQNAAIAKAGADVGAAAKAVRVTANALSCASNVEFMGNTSSAHFGRGGEASGFCSLPVKLEFEDKGARIHFERTLREKCDIRASMSLPKGIRAAQTSFYKELKELYPDQIVMTRPDVATLSFVALVKKDGEKTWVRTSDTRPIDPSALTDTRTNPPPPQLSSVATGGGGTSRLKNTKILILTIKPC